MWPFVKEFGYESKATFSYFKRNIKLTKAIISITIYPWPPVILSRIIDYK